MLWQSGVGRYGIVSSGGEDALGSRFYVGISIHQVDQDQSATLDFEGPICNNYHTLRPHEKYLQTRRHICWCLH